MHTHCLIKRGHTIVSSDWSDFLLELEVLLCALIDHGRAYMVIAISGPEDVFVQVAVPADEPMRAEVPTGALDPSDRRRRRPLHPRQAVKLRELGWRAPLQSADGVLVRPLWSREAQPEWLAPEPLFAELLVHTLVEVFLVASPADLALEFGCTPEAGGVKRLA